MSSQQDNIASIAPGVLILGEPIVLAGSRCEECGVTFFPPRAYCRDPRCVRRPTRHVGLSSTGSLFSFTTQHHVAPPPFRIDPDLTPYTIVSVELPEGLRVLGLLDAGQDPANLRIGQAMHLTAGRLYTNADGGQVLTWKFKPRPVAA